MINAKKGIFMVLFKKIKVTKASDLIIGQVKQLIINGELVPGGKLPPENNLTKQLGVKLGDVREALRKLEFYGILETKPQNGTFIANIEAKPLEALISNIQALDTYSNEEEIVSLMDTRMILEKRSVELAALRANEEDIDKILKAHSLYSKGSQKRLHDDIYFHLKIVDSSKSPILKYLITLITPQIIRSIGSLEERTSEENINKKFIQTIEEHKKIIKSIVSHDPCIAAEAMEQHLKNSVIGILKK